MRNVKALAAIERVEQSSSPFDNPELTAMAAICEILQELPDEAARLRVMRWSFGRFSPEFKRPLPDSVPEPVAIPPVAVVRPEPIREVPAPVPVSRQPLPVVRDEPAVPQQTAPVADGDDIARQISELNDLFPGSRDVDPGSI